MTNHHVTFLEIDKDALISNVRYFKSKIRKETKLLAVVKATGYGSSDVIVSKALEKEVDYFAVAYADEGIRLREQGITLPIIVLHPQKENLGVLIEYQLEPNCYSFSLLSALINVIKDRNIQSYPIHLKVNTGLNRLGFDERDIDEIVNFLEEDSQVEVRSILSHIAASEDANEQEFTLHQIASFTAFFEKITQKFTFQKIPFRHMTNTSGILNYAPEAQFEMVRLGIGMYGFDNNAEINTNLKDVLCLKSVVSQIHTVEKGQSVGYNRAFTALRTTRVATIPIGHADGYSRHLGQGKGYVFIGGQKAFVVGNVCMDIIMVDVTDISCSEGDEVVVYKDRQHIEDLAKKANTISYEMLTMIGQRIRRIVV